MCDSQSGMSLTFPELTELCKKTDIVITTVALRLPETAHTGLPETAHPEMSSKIFRLDNRLGNFGYWNYTFISSIGFHTVLFAFKRL